MNLAVLIGCAVVSGASAQGTAVSEDKSKAAADGLAEVPPPQSAPRPQQIEPIVYPVKRVLPKTPVLDAPAQTSAKGKAPGKAAKKTAIIVPERPNCDPGFKVDDSGRSCVRASSGTSMGKPEKSTVRKKR